MFESPWLESAGRLSIRRRGGDRVMATAPREDVNVDDACRSASPSGAVSDAKRTRVSRGVAVPDLRWTATMSPPTFQSDIVNHENSAETPLSALKNWLLSSRRIPRIKAVHARR
jgi:hypothetical protein